jgi:hypothetical protein
MREVMVRLGDSRPERMKASVLSAYGGPRSVAGVLGRPERRVSSTCTNARVRNAGLRIMKCRDVVGEGGTVGPRARRIVIISTAT